MPKKSPSSEPSIENSVLDYIKKNEQSSEAEPSVIVSEDLLEEARRMEEEPSGRSKELSAEETQASTEFPPVSMEDINSISPRDSGLGGEFITENFNSENQKLHDQLPPKGKKMAERIFDVIYKIPGINRIVGKLEIAYNQSRADKNREVNSELKGQMDKLSQEITVLDGAKKEIDELTSHFDKQGIAGIQSLYTKVNDLETRKNDLLEKKKNIQSEFGERENKIKIHTAEITRVADTLIERYNESLEPLKKELESLQLAEDKVDLDGVVFEAVHEEQKKRLDDIERKKIELRAALTKTGMSEKEIQNFGAIQSLDKVVIDGMTKIYKEDSDIAIKRAEIIAKIEKTKAKAGIYEGKIKEFERVKNNKPVEQKITIKAEVEKDKIKVVEKSVESAKESAYGNYDRPDIGNYINRWNAFLSEKYGGQNAANELVKLDNFLEATGLSRSSRLDAKKFKNILDKYYKYARIPTVLFKHNADEFFAKKINL